MITWQELVLNRLNIGPRTSTIVIDYIGLLRDQSFISYLNSKTINFFIAEDIQDVLNNIKTTQLIIVAPKVNLPSYLEKHATIIHFDYHKLPIEIEPEVLSLLSLKQLSLIISYLNAIGSLKLVHKNNYKNILENAESFLIQRQLKDLETEILNLSMIINSYVDILKVGQLWGRYVWLCSQMSKVPNSDLIENVDKSIEKLILDGIIRDAFYESITTFKTVDKIIPYIKSQKPDKFALVCFDAMGVAEWYLLKNYLSNYGFDFIEKFIFALIPTMTSISRSAIFYGNAEHVYDLKTINEDKAFTENFSDYTVRSFREGELTNREQLLGINAVKIIYNVFDDIAHKTILPPKEKTKNMYFKNVANYLFRSKIKEELQLLIHEGFKLWFCSDHGSIVATGNGQKIDKYLMESSSKRATLIEKTELAKFYDVNQYEIPFGQDKVVLLAKGRTYFSQKNKIEITHGGIAFDELIVPFVEVTK